MTRVVLVLGDQLTKELSALRAADKSNDTVMMAEVSDEASYVQHHPKKIALIFAAMRKFAAELEKDGWNVVYTQLDDTENAGSIVGEILRRCDQFGANEVLATEPGEWRLITTLKYAPVKIHLHPDDRFIASHGEFEAWAEGRKALRMEYFYREMRRKTGLLMDGDAPVQGQWNFDHDNRKPAPDEIEFEGPLRFEPDAITSDVLDLVEATFKDNFGSLRPFWFATTRREALQQLDHFVTHGLPKFGDFQDAMMNDNRFLYHGLVSTSLNIGLLTPKEVCEAAAAAPECWSPRRCTRVS